MIGVPKYPGCYEGLTHKQADLLSYIRRYVAGTNGVPPSFEEMKDAMGLSSKSGIHRLLISLKERGYVEHDYARPRSLRLRESLAENRVLGLQPTDALIAELQRRGFTFVGVTS